DLADAHGRARVVALLAERAGDRRRDLHRDLVALELEDGLVRLDVVADALDPARDDRLGDRLAQRGHDEFRHRYRSPCDAGGRRQWLRRACSSGVRCSGACARVGPVAGLAPSGRLTARTRSQPKTSASRGTRKLRGPMFAGSSWTQTKRRAPGNRATASWTSS